VARGVESSGFSISFVQETCRYATTTKTTTKIPRCPLISLVSLRLCCCMVQPPAAAAKAPAAKKRRVSEPLPTTTTAAATTKRKSAAAAAAAAPLKRKFKAPTPAAIAAAASAKRRNEAPQTGISFVAQEKYKVGMKLLLDDSIYDNAGSVRSFRFVLLLRLFFVVAIVFCCCQPIPCSFVS
jgi:hypothetical protein